MKRLLINFNITTHKTIYGLNNYNDFENIITILGVPNNLHFNIELKPLIETVIFDKKIIQYKFPCYLSITPSDMLKSDFHLIFTTVFKQVAHSKAQALNKINIILTNMKYREEQGKRLCKDNRHMDNIEQEDKWITREERDTYSNEELYRIRYSEPVSFQDLNNLFKSKISSHENGENLKKISYYENEEHLNDTDIEQYNLRQDRLSMTLKLFMLFVYNMKQTDSDIYIDIWTKCHTLIINSDKQDRLYLTHITDDTTIYGLCKFMHQITETVKYEPLRELLNKGIYTLHRNWHDTQDFYYKDAYLFKIPKNAKNKEDLINTINTKNSLNYLQELLLKYSLKGAVMDAAFSLLYIIINDDKDIRLNKYNYTNMILVKILFILLLKMIIQLDLQIHMFQMLSEDACVSKNISISFIIILLRYITISAIIGTDTRRNFNIHNFMRKYNNILNFTYIDFMILIRNKLLSKDEINSIILDDSIFNIAELNDNDKIFFNTAFLNSNDLQRFHIHPNTDINELNKIIIQTQQELASNKTNATTLDMPTSLQVFMDVEDSSSDSEDDNMIYEPLKPKYTIQELINNNKLKQTIIYGHNEHGDLLPTTIKTQIKEPMFNFHDFCYRHNRLHQLNKNTIFIDVNGNIYDRTEIQNKQTLCTKYLQNIQNYYIEEDDLNNFPKEDISQTKIQMDEHNAIIPISKEAFKMFQKHIMNNYVLLKKSDNEDLQFVSLNKRELKS